MDIPVEFKPAEDAINHLCKYEGEDGKIVITSRFPEQIGGGLYFRYVCIVPTKKGMYRMNGIVEKQLLFNETRVFIDYIIDTAKEQADETMQ